MTNPLEIQNLNKDYGDFKLQEINLTLPSGYIMGLIGPNGAGKTTLIKCIMNLIVNRTGEIRLFGMDYEDHEVDIKQRIGFVYDNPNYYEHLNLSRIKRAIAPFYTSWDEDLFQVLVRQFELPLKKSLKKFSKGMTMKAALAIALSHHADFIVLDEPTSGLDPVFRREFLDLLRELMQEENRSILFSTHITSDIEQVADYITFINAGRIVFTNSREELNDQFSVVKGGLDLLNSDTRQLFSGIRETPYGFEALTENIGDVRSALGESAVYDKATLEDIMYFIKTRM